MAENERAHTREELRQWQALPLEGKINAARVRIAEWYNAHGGAVYVSFSGGKDSTVLLHLVREMIPDVEAVYIDTGIEPPGVREFVRKFENVTILHPDMKFRDVVRVYGWPIISKAVAHNVGVARRNPDGAVARHNFSPEKVGPFAHARWAYLIDAPFLTSDKCCYVMKENPVARYERRTKNARMLGTLAEESENRTAQWLRDGCNQFTGRRPVSRPLSVWTERDVLEYVVTRGIEIAPVYGEIVRDADGRLRTTGCERTGCMFCGFGAHREKRPNRFERMREEQPKLYAWLMRPEAEGGCGMGAVLDYIKCTR